VFEAGVQALLVEIGKMEGELVEDFRLACNGERRQVLADVAVEIHGVTRSD